VTGPIGCEEVESSVAELAVGSLAGEERAAVVAHLAGCASCRRLAEDLIDVVDELSLITPGVDPPAGFESRVLAGIARDSETPVRLARRVRPPLRWLAALAAAVAIFAGGSVAGVRLSAHRDRPAAVPAAAGSLRAAALVGPGGATWGRAYVQGGPDGWVFVAMRWDLPDGQYSVQLAGPGIPTVQLDGLALVNGRASLGRSLDGDLDAVRTVRVVDGRGREICRATLT